MSPPQQPTNRSSSLLVLLILVAGGIPATLLIVPSADAMVVRAQEDWGATWGSSNAVSKGWNTTGQAATTDATNTINGTVPLKLVPRATAGSFVSVQKYFGGVLPLDKAPYSISTYFDNLNGGATADTFNVSLNKGGYVGINFTGGSARNQVFLFAGNGSSYQAYPPMFNATPSTWYNVNISIDPNTFNFSSLATDSSGNTIGTTRPINNPLQALYSSAEQSPGGQAPQSPDQPNGIYYITFTSTYTSSGLVPPALYGMDFGELRVWMTTPPNPPTLGPAQTGPGAGQISLTWAPPKDNGGASILYYNVYASNDNTNYTFLNTTPLTTFTDVGLSAGVTRWYEVKAVNVAGEGNASNAVSGRTFSVPTAPRNLTAAPGTSVGSILISWQRPTDNGSATNLSYDIYRGLASGNETLVGTVNGATNATDPNQPNGTTIYYYVVARDPAGSSSPSNEAHAIPMPDAVTAPYNVTLSPGLAWSASPRTLNFSYRATVSQCSLALLCPVNGEWAVWAQNDTGALVLIANGTDARNPTAQTIVYTKSVNVSPAGLGGNHTMIVAVNTRVGSTAWNATGLLYWNEFPGVGNLTALTGPAETPTHAAPDGTVSVVGNYTVFENQCGSSQACPVHNDWQILLRGGQLNPRGAILSHGGANHTGHKGNETFAISTSFQTPNVAPGNYTLVLAVRHNATAPWVENSVPFRVDSCTPLADYGTIYDDPLDVPPGLPASPTHYSLAVPGLYTRGPITLYNGCQAWEPGAANDTDYEIGQGGGILHAHTGEDHVMILTRDGRHAAFVVGVDHDGDGRLGDSPLDCVSPPIVDIGLNPCPVGNGDQLLMFLLNDPEHPYITPEGSPIRVPGVIYTHSMCGAPANVPPLLSTRPCPPSGYQADSDGDGLGDQWEKPYKDLAKAHPEIQSTIDSLLQNPIADIDGDGLSTFDEYRWNTVPIGPLTVAGQTYFPNALDYEGTDAQGNANEGWHDGAEHDYWNDPNNDPAFGNVQPGMAAAQDPDMTQAYGRNALPGGNSATTVHNSDSDGDGINDYAEFSQQETFPEFTDSDCAPVEEKCLTPAEEGTHKAAVADPNAPGTGDGIDDYNETLAWEMLEATNASYSGKDLIHLDRDGDGTKTNLLDADSDGDGITDGQEFSIGMHGLCPVACTDPIQFDTDGDGLLDGHSIKVAQSDPRWSIFEGGGIVYINQTDGSRLYQGELDQSPPDDPLSSDTNKNGIPDGQEVGGGAVHPANVDYESQDPTNMEVTDLDQTAATWLQTGEEQLTSYAAISTDVLTPPDLVGNLAAMINPSTDVVAPITSQVWNVDSTIIQATDCIHDLPTGPAASTVQCLVGVAQNAAANTLSLIDTVLPNTLGQGPISGLTSTLPLGALNVSSDTYVVPTVSPSNLTHVLQDPLNLPQGGPQAPDPWSSNAYNGTPVKAIFWNQSVLPQFLASAYGSTGLSGYPFDTLAQSVPPAVVRNVDSGAFNLIVNTTSNPTGAICTSRPIGVPVFISLSGDCNASVTNADLSVTAQPMTDATGTQQIDVQIQNLKAGNLLSPMKVLVVAFVQVPVAAPDGSSGIVAALGDDARNDQTGLPARLDIRVGTNAVQNAILGASSYYSFHIESSDATATTHPVAAYYRVTEPGLNGKQIIPGEMAEVQLAFNQTPSVADGNFSTQTGGFHVKWTGSPVNVFNAKIFTAHAGQNESVNITANGLPATFTTDYYKTDDETKLQHTSGGTIPQLMVAFEGHTPTPTGSQVTHGYLNATSIPAQVTLDINRDTSTALFTPLSASGSAATLGGLDVWSQTYQGTETPCYQAGNSTEYLIFNATATGSCLTIHVTNLGTTTLDYSNNFHLNATRSAQAPAPRLTVQLDSVDGSHIYADALPWPSMADVAYSRGANDVSFTSAMNVPSLSLNVTMHKPVRIVQGHGLTPSSDLKIVALDLPGGINFDASYPTGSITANAVLSRHIRDLSFSYMEGGAPAPGLGDDDGVIISNDATQPAVTAMRLRDFGSASFSASIQGVSLLTDTGSQNPFHLRWVGSGAQWLTSDLPRIPKNVSATIQKDPSHFAIFYNATEKMSGLAGHLNMSDGTFTVAFNLQGFPMNLTLNADMVHYTVDYNASSAPGMLEAHLVGNDGTLVTPTTTTYLVLDQLHTVNVSGTNVPQFHIRASGVTDLHGNFSSHAMTLVYKSNASLQDATIRYVDNQGGWFDQNITGSLPPELNMSFTTNGFRWNATPNYAFSGVGSANFTDFEGKWSFTNLPSLISGNWTKSATGFEFNATSSSNVALLDFNGSARLTPGAPESIVRVRVEGLPPWLDVKGDTTNGTYSVNLSDKNGNVQAAQSLEAAFVSNKDNGFPTISGLSGAVAYGRFDDTGPTAFFFRLPHLENFSARLTPDPLNGLKRNFTYLATTDQEAHVDIAKGDTSIRASADTLPQILNVSLLLTDAHANLTTTTYGATSKLVMEWNNGTTTVRANTSSLPKSLYVDYLNTDSGGNGVARITMHAQTGVTGSFSMTDAGQSLEHTGTGDYITLHQAQNMRLASHVTDLTDLLVDTSQNHIVTKGGTTRNMELDLQTLYVTLTGKIVDLPGNLDLTYPGGTAKNLTWIAGAGTTSAWMHAIIPGNKYFHVDATTLPATFWAEYNDNAASPMGKLWTGDGSAFGSVLFLLAANGCRGFPTMAAPGVAFDLTSGVCMGVKLDHVLHAMGSDAGVLSFQLDTTSATANAQVHFQHSAMGVDLALDSLPSSLTGTFTPSSATTSMMLDLTASTSIGGGTIGYVSTSGDSVNATVTNLPSHVFIELDDTDTWKGLNYNSSASATDNVGFVGDALTSKGWHAHFDVTQIPADFSMLETFDSTGVGMFHYEATTGQLTGEVLAAPQGSHVYQPVDRGQGASVSLSNSNQHAWLRVAGLTKLLITHEDGIDQVSLASSSTRTSAPLHLYYENDSFQAGLDAADLPATVDVTLINHQNYYTGTYTASSGIDYARIQAVTKGQNGDRFDANITNAPASFHFDLNRGATRLFANITRDDTATTAPSVTLSLVKPTDTIYAQGTLQGIPAQTSVQFDTGSTAAEDPQNAPSFAPSACPFKLTTDGSFTSAQLQAGIGDPKSSPTLRAGDGWASINLHDPRRPSIDVKVQGLEDALFCATPDSPFHVMANFTATHQHLNVSFQNQTNQIYAQLDQAPAGDYDISDTFDPATNTTTLEYTSDAATNLGHVNVQTDIPVTLNIGQEKTSYQLVVDGSDVPGYAKIQTNSEKLTLDSNDARIGRLHVTASLIPSSGGAAASSSPAGPFDVPFPHFVVDAPHLNVGDLMVGLADNGKIAWDGSEPNEFDYHSTGNVELALRLEDVTDAKITMAGIVGGISVDNLKLRLHSPLRVYVADGNVRILIPSMPTDIAAHFAMYGISATNPVPWIEADAKPVHDAATIQVLVGTTLNLTVPLAADKDSKLTQLLAQAGTAKFSAEGPTGMALDFVVDGSHFIWEKVTGQNAEIQIDLDGAKGAPATPHFFDIPSASASAIQVGARWGQNGLSIAASSLDITSAALVGAKKDATTGITFFRDGAVGASQATIQFVIDGVQYVAGSDLW
ncbi:MAG: hypothetical protein QOE90_1488 [Thermoplasmata archaeon]|jgi:hypothetical protein|nr:hypothetical protein [Thermoplasmata archaeon]